MPSMWKMLDRADNSHMVNIIHPQQTPPGINPRVLPIIEDMLVQGRNTFGSAGASLTWGIDGTEDGDVNAGIDGERMTARILREWVKDKPTAVAVNSVGLPGSKGDTDHILVVGNTILLIDSKRWKSKRKYTMMPDGVIKRGTVTFDGGHVKMLPFLKIWRDTIKPYRAAGVVCIAQNEVFVPYDNNWYKSPFKLVTAEQLPEFLDNFFNKVGKSNESIDLGLVSMIVTRAIKPRDRRKELIRTELLN